MQDLPPPITTVEAVEIRPARLPTSIAQDAYSVIVIGEDQLDDDRRLDQSLAEAPGVTLFRRTDSLMSNPTTQGVSLRSIGPSGAGRALVTLDGIPQNDPFGQWVIWADLPNEMIKSATIIRGGGAGPYGSGALTGVVSLEERSEYGLVASAEAGSLDTQRASVVGATTLGAFDVVGSLYGGRSDGFIPVRMGRGPADTNLWVQAWSGSVRATTDLGEGRLSFRAGAFDERSGNGLADGFARASGEHASVSWARSPTPTSRGYRLQGWVRTSDLENVFVSVPANRSSTTVVNRQFETPATGLGFNAAVRGAADNRQWELGFDLRTASGDSREESPFNGRIKNSGGAQTVMGVYAETTVVEGPWLVTGALRADRWANRNGHFYEYNANGTLFGSTTYSDRDGILPTARLGVRRDLGGGTYARGAAYAGFRAPSLNELYRGFRVGNIVTNANSELEPEKLGGFEVGFGGQGMDGAWDITVFYNELTDAITNVTIGNNLRQRQNADTIKAIGVEAEGVRRLTPTLTGRAAIAYTDAETDAGLRPQQTARFSATAGLDWRPVERAEFSVQLRHEGDRFDDDLNTIALDEATVVDLQAGYLFQEGVWGFVAAENLFDEAVENGLTSGEINYAAPQVFSIGLKLRR